MPTVESLAELSAAIDALQGALDEPVAAVLGDGALERLVALRRQIDRLESSWLALVGVAHASGAAAAHGYVTTAAFLRHACRLSPGDARSRVDVAASIENEPQTRKAFAEGEISYQHVKTIVSALEPLPTQIRVEAAPVLVEASRRHDPTRVAQIARRLRHIVDPDGQATLDDRRHEKRWLEIATSFDGLAFVRGVLDPESAAIVSAAIEAGAKPTGEDDERTGSQRRADALVSLARVALDTGDLPDVAAERPHLTVIVDLATLQNIGQDSGQAPAHLPNGEPLSAETARRIACDAAVTRVSVSPKMLPTPKGRHAWETWRPPPRYFDALPPPLRGPTQVLDVGRAARTANPAIRKALAVRDKGCAMPGCDRPPSHCEAHHVVHWCDGGRTALDNMALLCWQHHRYVHENHWQIKVLPDGGVSITPPLADSA